MNLLPSILKLLFIPLFPLRLPFPFTLSSETPVHSFLSNSDTLFIHISHSHLHISSPLLVLQWLSQFPDPLVPNILRSERMPATIAFPSKAPIQAMTRSRRHRGRGYRSQASFPAGCDMSESKEDDVGDSGGGNLAGMISREFYRITLGVSSALESSL